MGVEGGGGGGGGGLVDGPRFGRNFNLADNGTDFIAGGIQGRKAGSRFRVKIKQVDRSPGHDRLGDIVFQL